METPSPIQAVFFDLDGTLLDHGHASDAAARTFYHRHKMDFATAEEDFVRLWIDLVDAAYERFISGAMALDQARRWRMHRLFAAAGRTLTDSAADRFAADAVAAYESHWRLFPDVLPCLDALVESHRLGVITNGSGRQQRRKLERLGLFGRFRIVQISQEAGAAKPGPAIFRNAARRMGLAPGQCIHVGDSLEIDARGAEAAGMTGVWLDRKGDAGKDLSRRPELRIRTLGEIPHRIVDTGKASSDSERTFAEVPGAGTGEDSEDQRISSAAARS